MSKVLSIVGQVVLFGAFVVVFLVGSLFNPLHLHWFLSHPEPLSTRSWVPDGLLLMTALWVVVVGIEAAAKRLRTAGLWTTVAFVLAALVGLVSKFGWATHSLYN